MTRKDHFPLPFINQMLERIAGHVYYSFLDDYSGYNQIHIAREDQEKRHSHVRLALLHIVACPLGYAMHQLLFSGVR